MKNKIILFLLTGLVIKSTFAALHCPPMNDVKWVIHATKLGYFSQYLTVQAPFPPQYSIPVNAKPVESHSTISLHQAGLPVSINHWLRYFSPQLKPRLIINSNPSAKKPPAESLPLWLPSKKPLSTNKYGSPICLYTDTGLAGPGSVYLTSDTINYSASVYHQKKED